MIGYVAYQYRRTEAKSGVKFNGAKILVLLAESGLVYAILQIIRLSLILSFGESTPAYGSLDTGYAIFQSANLVVVAMYPPSLIIIIDRGYSIADTVQLSTTSGSPGLSS
ncbi:hypothetical protein BDV98DRAFT_577791 [Pterulicium gracile]|uniref:Uncharacterized protein n=1 Tax=Pterulicium gracile TaxID=1884261 RepID=A0A5C3Q0B5_9AGAR|nr:hypothetical protein BDV98DRAFT_577791 [Pterula gracilis]